MKARSKYVFLIVLAIFMGITLILIILSTTFLPSYVEKRLVPEIIKATGIKSFSWDIRRIGLTGLDLGKMIIKGDDTSPILEIASVRIDYTPAGIFHRQLEKIVLSGIQIRFEIIGERLLLPGFDLEKLLGEPKKEKQTSGSAIEDLPVSIQTIVLENVMLNGKWNGKTFRLPLDLTIIPGSTDFRQILCKAQFFPFDQKIEVEIDLDIQQKSAKLKTKASKFSLGSLPSWLIPVSDLFFRGELDFLADTKLDILPFSVSTTEINLLFQDLSIFHEVVTIKSPDSKDQMLDVHINYHKNEPWQFKTSGFRIISPANCDILDVNGNVTITPEGMKTFIEMETGFYGAPNLEIMPTMTGLWEISGRLQDKIHWQFKAESKNSTKNVSPQKASWYHIKTNDFNLEAVVPNFTISGKGNIKTGRSQLTTKISRIQLKADPVSVNMPLVEVKLEKPARKTSTKSVPEKLKSNDDPSVAFSFRLPDLKMSVESTKINIPEVFVSGEIKNINIPEKGIDAQVSLKNAVVSDDLAIVKGIHFEIPVSWPPIEKNSSKGLFKIDTVQYQNMIWGSLEGNIRQHNLGVKFQGNFNSKLLKGLILNFSGNTGWNEKGLETRIDYQMPEYVIPETMDLGSFVSDVPEMTLNGHLETKGNLIYSDTETMMTSRIKLSNGHLRLKEPALAISGIHLDFFIPDLLKMKSAPHQKIEFSSASMGNLEVTEGEIVFQMESPQRLFLEKSHFQWCGGNVDTNSSLYAIDENDINLNLYCDRLNLARVLEQLGGIKAQGEGAVNGRIPISYHNKKLRFDDGFLFSTPGVGGTIRLTGTDVLMSGVPEGTPQFSQLDLAREALKHYDYKWAKVNIDTKDKILHLGLELDGKPVKPLPFVFNHEFGGFVRVGPDKPGSNFQGIRLNVNFKLPLDEVLKYGKGFSDLM
jgi:hypothetical protein